MPNKAAQTAIQSAAILTFDPITRQSDRRRKADGRAQRAHRRAERRQLVAESETLGIAVEAFEADDDLHAHYDAVSDLEAAYRVGASEGRRVLLTIISRYFGQGHETGLEDAKMEIRQQIAVAAGRVRG